MCVFCVWVCVCVVCVCVGGGVSGWDGCEPLESSLVLRCRWSQTESDSHANTLPWLAHGWHYCQVAYLYCHCIAAHMGCVAPQSAKCQGLLVTCLRHLASICATVLHLHGMDCHQTCMWLCAQKNPPGMNSHLAPVVPMYIEHDFDWALSCQLSNANFQNPLGLNGDMAAVVPSFE